MSIVLGNRHNNGELTIDLKELVRTRLLIFAGSGYGKSWLIRRLLEQSYNLIHQIVLDREGDFYTMRKQYPYLLASANREVKPDIILSVDMAERLARTTMEMRASIIVDLSSLEPDARVEFVDRFVKTLLNLPKSLRHHAMVVIDEVQEFCDQDERISSTKTLKLFAEQARKRGLCPVYATQRIADVNKTAISQLHNRLIGGASLDIDVARATLAAGFMSSRRTEIEELQTGEFFARGPAISKKAVKVKIGPVETPHPEVGVEIEPPVPVTDEKMQRALKALRASATLTVKTGKDEEVTLISDDNPFQTPPGDSGFTPINFKLTKHGTTVQEEKLFETVGKLEDQLEDLKKAVIHRDEQIVALTSSLADAGKQLEQKDETIHHLEVNLQAALDESNSAESLRNSLHKFLDMEDLDVLRAEHQVMMGEGTDAVNELKLEGEQARVTIEKKVVTKPAFKEGSPEWILVDLITDGMLNTVHSVKDVYRMIIEKYSIDKNYPRYYKNSLWPAMSTLSHYPYNYLEKDGILWKTSKIGHEYTSKKVVAI